MSKTAQIIAAAWKAWAEWQSEKNDRSGSGSPKTWAAIQAMFRIMDDEGGA